MTMMSETWPDMWQGVLGGLARGDDTFAAIDGSAPAAQATVEAIEEQMPEVVQVGRHLTASGQLGDVDRLFGSLVEPTLLLDLDVLFTPHLHLNVVTLLRSAARRTPIVAVWPGQNGPVSVDKIQPFLARQRQTDERVLLVVLDGCGLTQWAHIIETAPLRVVRPGAALAMIPTLTSVSRQAIAAGTTPNGFADSIDTTTKESQRWSSAWRDEGVTAIWLRIDGARVDELDAVLFSTSEAIGLVVSAPDELMHGAELLGDAGFHSGVEAWIRGGVIGELIARAEAHRFTVWVTADHGNLEVVPTPSKREGVFLDRSRTRVRRYQNRTMRDGAVVDGLTWDDIPGLSGDEAEQLLFAPGRVGWGSARVSHGGLSLDELIVPFVQVAAP